MSHIYPPLPQWCWWWQSGRGVLDPWKGAKVTNNHVQGWLNHPKKVTISRRIARQVVFSYEFQGFFAWQKKTPKRKHSNRQANTELPLIPHPHPSTIFLIWLDSQPTNMPHIFFSPSAAPVKGWFKLPVSDVAVVFFPWPIASMLSYSFT